MTIKEIIHKDIPFFTGLTVVEGFLSLKDIKQNGVTLAWVFNEARAKKFHKILIAGNKEDKGKYFIADIKEILNINELIANGNYKEAIDFQNKNFGNWISDRQNNRISDNALDDRKAIIIDNCSEIKKFSTKDFNFFSNPVTYIQGEREDDSSNDYLGETIKITNIGKIEKANIKLDGLTIIAGKNNTGKSTIGKLLFSIVKAISRYEQDLNENKKQRLLKKIEKLYFIIRRLRHFARNEDVVEQFHPKKFFLQVEYLINENENDLFSVSSNSVENEVEAIFKYKYELVNGFQLRKEEKQKAIKILDEISQLLLTKEDKDKQIKRALNKVLYSEFYSEITPKGTDKTSKVEYLSGSNTILDFKISKNKVTTLELNDDLVFDDVIFIESPLLLQMFDLIRSADTLFENENIDRIRRNPKLPLHIKDLIVKIENAKYFSDNLFEKGLEQIDILIKISNIINGGYTFEEKDRDFIFSQKVGTKKNVKIKPTNTASGVKSFGIIQLLIQANVLDDRSLLVIDEPENHLHPDWQIKYAKMIIELIKNDISVIISSHSPYMIQALKYFSEKEGIKEKSNFYLAEFNENNLYTNITDVTKDLNRIFSKLAKPLKELVWQ